MKHHLVTRRDILKLIGTAGLFAPMSKIFKLADNHGMETTSPQTPNIIILLFDTLSAVHMGLYGYGRNTTPNIDRFAKTSTVFHRNYSSSNFTQPSTASLLTGVYPWSHRSLNFFTPLLNSFKKNNIFTELASSHKSITYTHNIHTANILEQFKADIDLLKPINDLVIYDGNKYQSPFKNDKLLGAYAARRWIETYYAPSYSLFLNPIFTIEQAAITSTINNKFKSLYPLGLGDRDGYLFKLEDAIDWIGQITAQTTQPYFGYFHLLPPHEVYRPRVDFLGMFTNDNFNLHEKPEHHFSENITQEQQKINCQLYDEYIALVDAEFGRLVQQMEQQGTLENSYLILTSDHGQLLERGIHGHSNPALYESVIQTPLIIHSPGQTEGLNIYSLTSIIDIVPTILDLMNQNHLNISEGVSLPTLGGIEDKDRIIFSMYTQQNAKLKPLTNVTYSAIQWPYKLINYRGYLDYDDVVELYNLEIDPDELDNIAKEKNTVVDFLKDELLKRQAVAEKKSLM
jgi:arylsulfatase A-like enzyme